MIVRPTGLDLRRSLRSALGEDDSAAVEAAARRQERTIDAVLQRLYDDEAPNRREIVLLADEVGLGKTFVALGVAWSVLRQRSQARLPARPVLVVTPHSHALFKKWRREAERFLQLVAPSDEGFEVRTASTPHDLARALRVRRPTLVIARMPAFSARLHRLDTARMAALHALFHMDGFGLSLDQRLALLDDWPEYATRERLDLRRSSSVWDEARATHEVGFDEKDVWGAWKRLEILDQKLCAQIRESWARVRRGQPKRSSFWEDLRELCRAALGQTARHCLPLVIVDEIHNWKNHPKSWEKFLHMLGLRTDRLLGLSATPFQLGPHELIQVLKLRQCVALSSERRAFLDARVAALASDLQAAKAAGDALRNAWGDVGTGDLEDIEGAWPASPSRRPSVSLPPRLRSALAAAGRVRTAHEKLSGSLRPFLLRHRRNVSHRAWWVGREANAEAVEPSARGNALRWRPGVDVSGDAELVHYLMMRAVQEDKGGHGSTTLGADLGGSYAFFREGELSRLLPGRTSQAKRYLTLVECAVGDDGHEHPKVALTAERAFRAWLMGEKSLVFCFNIATVEAIQKAVVHRIEKYDSKILTAAFDCSAEQLDLRLKNFQKRLYDYRQAVFLLFQDHPLAGVDGRVPPSLALEQPEIEQVAARLALAGPPRDRSRFDRRRVLAATEQVLVVKWQQTQHGQSWLDDVLKSWRLAETSADAITTILSNDWSARRRILVEGVVREAEIEPLPDDDDSKSSAKVAKPDDIAAWRDVLARRAGRATLAPYLPDLALEVPSLLSRWHAVALMRLPARLRALAARMLRRLVRSPGFLARFLLDDPAGRPNVDDESADDGWTSSIHRRYQTPPAAGESARERFSAYLETLQKAVGLNELIDAYEDASRNRDVVTRVTGSVAGSERDRLFMGFNTPLVPEVLIVTTVGQEGIDLHRECRHVVHHDLPWNPATLEQRTGRVDRIGSKTERMRSNGHGSGGGEVSLDVVIPYIAGTYDEHRFRVVHGRAHLFEVTMGGEYAVDGHRVVADAMEAESTEDDLGDRGSAWAPIPQRIVDDLRLHLESEAPRRPTGRGRKQKPGS